MNTALAILTIASAGSALAIMAWRLKRWISPPARPVVDPILPAPRSQKSYPRPLILPPDPPMQGSSATDSRKNEPNAIGCIALVLLCGFFFACSRGCGPSGPGRPLDGERGVLRAKAPYDVPVAATEDAFDKMMRAIHARDDYGLSLLRLAGLYWTEPQGTRILVLDAGLSTYEVRLESGSNAGRSCFVVTECVQKN